MSQSIIFNRIAAELNIKPQQVVTAVALLDEGATVPFIARYRKEVTGALDDNQLRDLEERLHYLRELEDRRATILKSIDEQGKLTDALKQDILSADTKTRLEELYLPYKPKRRTKGQIAIEAGLEPLAIALLADPTLVPAVEAVKFLNAAFEINDTKAALDGAKYILMERFAEDADLLARLRMFMQQEATLSVRVIADKAIEGEKFTDYFAYDEPLKKVPSHRALAILRGRNEGVLTVTLVTGDPEEKLATSPCEGMIAQHFNIIHQNRAADDWLAEVVKWTWRIKLLTYIELELLSQLREKAEADAIKVFADNLKDLLLAAPAGPKVTIGLDPGLRTGVKVAVVDATGKVIDHTTIYPTQPQMRITESETVIVALIEKYDVSLIAIGNGTGSRETDTFVGEMLKQYKLTKVQKIVVNEAGASVYSASELAAKEFPDLDVTIRGAVSIARRLQDPLAELVKIEPKSIGVGQYQHDVNQSQLARMLNAVVEDCVNAVGVDLNTASAPLLTRVSGLSSSLASNIVQYREANGAFKNRSDLMAVPRLGGKAFEQSAGFLRIMQGDNPLDASAVHPESYHLVEKIAQNAARDVASLIGDSQFLKSINTTQFVDDSVGEMTIQDILTELEKPGRDPRPAFKFAAFKEGVESIKDLAKNMLLEGVITNVAAFGAFVDIGVHQDGLVHISALSDQFVSDPRTVVKAGDIVKVKVMDVDVLRKRIALSMRLSDDADVLAMEKPIGESNKNQRKQGHKSQSVVSEKRQANSVNSAMASAFASAKQK
jgi:protein Tex